MKKLVVKLDLQEDRDKRRALKTVSTLSGIDEITIDMKERKLTVIGTVDPVRVVSKLRKKDWQVDIIFVGPSKEPEKEEQKRNEAKKEGKDEAMKEEPKKEDEKKEEPKKDEEKKGESDLVVGTAMPFRQYYPPMNTYYYVHHSMEENPNACVIC